MKALQGAVLAALVSVGAWSCSDDDVMGPRIADDPANAAREAGEVLESVRWNEMAQQAIGQHAPTPGHVLRAMAYLSLAQYGAAEAAAGRPDVSRAEMRGAVAGASATVLALGHPPDSAVVEQVLAQEATTLPAEQRAAFDGGVRIGREVAVRVMARARTDRFDLPFDVPAPTGPGRWFSSMVPPQPAWFPHLGEMRPFLLASGSQFRSGPPPAFGSPAFQAALSEVRRIADTRSPAQDSLAKVWDPRAAVFYCQIAIAQIEKDGLGERAAAHVLALMTATAMDAFIATHDAKFTYWLLRPMQADAGIALAIPMHNFPAYPSNHAAIATAAAQVLDDLFPREGGRFASIGTDAGLSRIYGGIHYRFDVDSGFALARRVSRHALDADRRGALLALTR